MVELNFSNFANLISMFQPCKKHPLTEGNSLIVISHRTSHLNLQWGSSGSLWLITKKNVDDLNEAIVCF